MQDPTREEMLEFLAPIAKQYEAEEFDIEEAIYWFAGDYHGGQWSNLYSALSTSPYKPGICTRAPGETAQELYDALEEHFN